MVAGVYAQSDDFGIWTSAEVKKKIFPGFDASVEGESVLVMVWIMLNAGLRGRCGLSHHFFFESGWRIYFYL
ncbi:MAG: hypothetical protein ACLUE2_00470 [Bacteroides cellulosilyticus]